MRQSQILLLALLFAAPSFAQTAVTRLEEAPGQAALSCPEPASIAGCTGLCWKWRHDLGTDGTSCGNSSLVSGPSRDGKARRFKVSWTGYGGERFSANLGSLDPISTHFSYEVWFYATDLSHVRSLEFDLNQVLANGETVIFGTQCNLGAGKWQYTTKVSGKAHWNSSAISCPRMSANSWHHLKIRFHRDAAGVVTYDSVAFDDVTRSFGASGPSSFTLDWKPLGTRVVNFQIGGDSTVGSTAVYLDSLSIKGWTLPQPPSGLRALVN